MGQQTKRRCLKEREHLEHRFLREKYTQSERFLWRREGSRTTVKAHGGGHGAEFSREKPGSELDLLLFFGACIVRYASGQLLGAGSLLPLRGFWR